MAIIDYKKRMRSLTRVPAPEAVTFVAAALFGDKWTGNRALGSLPAYRRDGGYETQVFDAELGATVASPSQSSFLGD
jgi:hypothetical protein